MDLNYKTFGQGPPLIILHGLFGTLDNWQTLARKLADQHTVYLVDLRNHGRSPHTQNMSYPLMADDLQQFLERNWIFETAVLGHSMGGKVAMQLALHYPDLVDRLVVVDIAPKAYIGGHQAIFDALLSFDLMAVADRKEADALLGARIKEVGVRQFLLKNLTRDKEGGGFRWKMNLPVIHQYYQEILAALPEASPYQGPSLFIRGGQSDYIQDEDLPALKALFPQADLKTIAGAGHWVHAEKPAELLQLVQDFLS